MDIETLRFNNVNPRIQLHWGDIRKCSCIRKNGVFWLTAAENAKQTSHLLAIIPYIVSRRILLDNSKNIIQPQASAQTRHRTNHHTFTASPSDPNNNHTFTCLLAIAVGIWRHPICASAAPRVHAQCSPGIKKFMRANPIAPFSTTIRNRTARCLCVFLHLL